MSDIVEYWETQMQCWRLELGIHQEIELYPDQSIEENERMELVNEYQRWAEPITENHVYHTTVPSTWREAIAPAKLEWNDKFIFDLDGLWKGKATMLATKEGLLDSIVLEATWHHPKIIWVDIHRDLIYGSVFMQVFITPCFPVHQMQKFIVDL